MANSKPVHKKTLWRDVKTLVTEDYTEVREGLLGEQLALLALVVGPIVGYTLFAVYGWNSVDTFGRVMLAVIFAIPAVLALANFRPPRFVRLFPKERVAESGRRLLGRTLYSRWFDLQDSRVAVVSGSVFAREEKEGGGLAALGCLAMLAGPLGLIFVLAQAFNKTERWYRCYELRIMQDTSGRESRVLARFGQVAGPRQLVKQYQAQLETDGG